MLIITVELHSAVTGAVSTIGRMRITNDGSGDASVGNYDVEIIPADHPLRPAQHARVEGYPRLQYSVWELVRRALGGRGSTPFVSVSPADQSPPERR